MRRVGIRVLPRFPHRYPHCVRQSESDGQRESKKYLYRGGVHILLPSFGEFPKVCLLGFGCGWYLKVAFVNRKMREKNIKLQQELIFFTLSLFRSTKYIHYVFIYCTWLAWKDKNARSSYREITSANSIAHKYVLSTKKKSCSICTVIKNLLMLSLFYWTRSPDILSYPPICAVNSNTTYNTTCYYDRKKEIIDKCHRSSNGSSL